MTTDSRSLYAALLGLKDPRTVEDVEMKLTEGEVLFPVALPQGPRGDQHEDPAGEARSRGFRNRERFKMAIYFHCGGLDLYPATARIKP